MGSGCSSSRPVPAASANARRQHYARLLHASFAHDEASTQPCRSLLDLCVLAVCKNLPAHPLDELPVELAQQILAELHSRRLLTQDALPFFRHVQLQSLVLSGCAGVQDEWLEGLTPQWLEFLDLSHCRGITDEGLHSFLNSAPALKVVRLSGCTNFESVLFMNQQLANCSALSSLDLGGCTEISPDCFEHLSHLRYLRSLSLQQCRIADSAIGGLQCSGLRSLDIGWCHQITNVGFLYLSRFGLLHELTMSRCRQLTDDGLEGLTTSLAALALSGCKHLTDGAFEHLTALEQLESLDLSNTEVATVPKGGLGFGQLVSLNMNNTAVSELQSIAQLKKLKHLNLDSCSIQDWDICKLLDGCLELQELVLDDTDVTDDALPLLGRMTTLRSLSLFYCQISCEGAAHLTSLSSLTRLNLDSRDVDDSSLVFLRPLTKLTSLDLFGARISDAGLQHLRHLTSLTELELCGGRITDNGLQHLRALTALEYLNLSSNAGISEVRLLSPLKRLRRLNLAGTQVTETGASALAHRCPELRAINMGGKQIEARAGTPIGRSAA